MTTNRTIGQVLEFGSATTLGSRVLVDTAKRWADGEWGGHLVRLSGGNNDGAVVIVQANDSQSLTFASSLAASAADPDTNYEILAAKLDTAATDETIQAINDLGGTLEELTRVLKQIRFGLGERVGLDLAEIDGTAK